MMGNWGWGTGNSLGMGGGFFFGIIFWILLVVAAIYLIKWLAAGNYKVTGQKRDSAVEILKERYAKGEINKQEFEEKMKDLK